MYFYCDIMYSLPRAKTRIALQRAEVGISIPQRKKSDIIPLKIPYYFFIILINENYIVSQYRNVDILTANERRRYKILI